MEAAHVVFFEDKANMGRALDLIKFLRDAGHILITCEWWSSGIHDTNGGFAGTLSVWINMYRAHSPCGWLGMLDDLAMAALESSQDISSVGEDIEIPGILNVDPNSRGVDPYTGLENAH